MLGGKRGLGERYGLLNRTNASVWSPCTAEKSSLRPGTRCGACGCCNSGRGVGEISKNEPNLLLSLLGGKRGSGTSYGLLNRSNGSARVPCTAEKSSLRLATRCGVCGRVSVWLDASPTGFDRFQRNCSRTETRPQTPHRVVGRKLDFSAVQGTRAEPLLRFGSP